MRDLLVIDDSATVRKLVELSMRGTDLRPHFAATGGEGVQRAAALAPSAILLDCVLPDMTGLDVCGALAADARTASIPILVVTAKHERTRIEFQPFTSVVDFIGKPFTAPDLIARVERAIGEAGSPAARPTRELAQRAARILYQRLREGLGHIPALLPQLEPGPVAPALAKRLLTPEVIEHLLVELRPIYEELLAGGPAAAGVPTAPRNDTIVDRAPGFSARVAEAALGSLDRRVLALSDGRTTLSAMADRLATDVRQVATTAASLVAQGLLVELAAVPRPR
ncbi:MAG TPA: response regulator, partial [Kofleriaceae bacterium]|nr:response regulator [Kofleriaceae bacterium]